MATLDIRVNCEMTKPVPVRHIDGMVFSQDVMGNRVLVSLFRDGVPESPGGAITANIVRSDGTTVVQNGTISGNLASVVLPASAYAVPGAIGIFVKHTSSGAISTIAAMTGYVYKSTTDTIIDPGTVVPDVSQLIAKIGECEAATEAANEAIAEIEAALETIEGKADEPSGTKAPGKAYGLNSNLEPVWMTVSGGGGGGGTSDYEDLDNKPQIGGVTLIGNKSLSDLGIVIPSVPVQDVQSGGVSIVNNGIAEINPVVNVSGSTPSITGVENTRYICGEVSTLSITAPASGCIDVTFVSGSTPTVLTVSSAKSGVTAIKWANGFDPSSLDANTTYEVNILDGEFGVVGSWT